jgi:hypothetical protein
MATAFIAVLVTAWLWMAVDDHRKREAHKRTFHSGNTCDC